MPDPLKIDRPASPAPRRRAGGSKLAAALRLSESRFRAARDASLDAFYLFESVRDARGRIRDFRFAEVNRRGARLLNHRRRELLGRNLGEVFPFVHTQGVFEKYMRVVETRRASVDVFPITVPNINARWIHEHAVPVGDALAVMSRDITGEMQVRHSLQRLSWQTVEAQEQERRRVARDLHDGVGQLLTVISFRLQAAAEYFRAAAPRAGGALARVRNEITAVQRAAGTALGEIRRIARHMRPAELDDLGFVAALRGLCHETETRTGLRITLRQTGSRLRPPRMIEETLYRIVQEGLTNVERHARARRVWIGLGQKAGVVSLTIRDNGRGFSVRSIRSSAGAGLANMQDRATRAGGSFVRRSPPGGGTEIFVQLPLVSPAGLAK